MGEIENDKELRAALYDLETRLLQPEIRHSENDLIALLTDDFVEITSSGRILNREEIISVLAAEEPFTFVLTDFVMRRLDSDTASVTYGITITVDDNSPLRSRRSSIWQHCDGAWRIIFHQGTPIAV